VRDTLHLKGSKKHFSPGFEGSQAVPARPSGRGMFESKPFGTLEGLHYSEILI
jgi:hypothetical protein